MLTFRGLQIPRKLVVRLVVEDGVLQLGLVSTHVCGLVCTFVRMAESRSAKVRLGEPRQLFRSRNGLPRAAMAHNRSHWAFGHIACCYIF